jgi:hypothetical protein
MGVQCQKMDGFLKIEEAKENKELSHAAMH